MKSQDQDCLSYKILVVENNLNSSDLLLMWLGMEGYQAVCARDGQEGFNLALAERPDLILTDLNLPNVDGVKMIRMLRGEPSLASLPVIVITAAYSGLVNQAIISGANVITFKPVIIEQVLREVKRLLPLVQTRGDASRSE